MAAKTGLIVAGLVSAIALGTGGYFANEWWVCSNLEDKFVDRMFSIRSDARLTALTSTLGVSVDKDLRRKIDDGNLDLMQMELEAVYERCGFDAGRAASRKGEAVLWGDTLPD